nr:hypothetical protein [uncultured Rhodoferax sp.]
MHTLEVLRALPARLQWLVFFRLNSIARFAEPDVIKRMFFLRSDAELSHYSHVVLTSEGRYLSRADGTNLDPAGDEPTPLKHYNESSILDRYNDKLCGLPLEDADCIGVGLSPGSPPAFLHVKLGATAGEAIALLSQEPTQRHYELLPVIGVEYLGGEATPAGYVARFRNRLATHIKAGMLSGFTRTENCNLFFIDHAEINEPLAHGLQSAFNDRLTSGRQIIKTFLHKLAVKAMQSPLAMTCVPPPPESPFPYGDLVPLGFLVRGIRAITQSQPAPALLLQVHEDLAIKKLVRYVNDAKSDGLWAFHRGRLVTATDSALVLLGVLQSVPCEALEAFADGQGAYYPQLSADEDVHGKMESDFSNAHWRQADFATTCLIRGLRTESQLPAKTPPSVITTGFDRRSGLFFANPYLVDWCTALAIKNDPALVHLQERLLEEILSSANSDGSYGQYDVGLSTGLAILCMGSLGYHGPALRLAQIRLLNLLDAGPWPISTPFYSTFMQTQEATPTSEHISCQGTLHALSLYRDGYRIVFSGVTGMALAIDSVVADNEAPIPRTDPHPRYRCTDLADYVARFALPPYIESNRCMVLLGLSL